MTVGETNQSRSAADLIKRDDALAAIDRALNNATGDLFDCHAAIRALPAVASATLTPNPVDDSKTADPVVNDPAAIREAALREAMDACTYVIKNIEILKADGETYETLRIQKIARGLVDVARQQIEALIEELVKERDYTEGTNDTLIALNQALEAKLAKAVKTLQILKPLLGDSWVDRRVLAVLAELEK